MKKDNNLKGLKWYLLLRNHNARIHLSHFRVMYVPDVSVIHTITKGVREVPVLKRLFIYTKKPGHFLVKVSWLLYTIDALNRRFDKHFADLIY